MISASIRNSITSYFIRRKNTAEHKAAMAVAATKANELLSNMPVAGPIVGRKFDLNDEYDDDVDQAKLENHVPVAGVYPLHKKDFTVLSANTIKKMKLLPHLYANPMQYLDYRIYEALLKHTFVGALADALVKYIIGNGFAPELELINPDEDETKNKKQIEQHQDIITKMIQIDNQIEQNDESHLDVSFTHKISAMIMSCLMYNRAALMFRYEKPIEIDGTSYPDIPSHVIFAHAQDLGMIDIDPEERRLRKVQWRHAMGSFVEVKDMIYLWNPLTSSKVHNSWYYGSSILSPMISASKILRQLLSEDFPAMAKTTWAGLFLLVVKNKGNTTESKNQEYNALAKNLIPGRPGILLEDPEDVNSFDIKFEPKVTEFRELFESMIKLCISILGLPHVGFYDEAATNRSTMAGKIQLTMRTTIEPMRDWIGDAISQQWYNRWFKLMYKDKPELLKLFRIKVSWNDLHISEWYDSIEAALELDGRKQLKDNAFGEITDIDNYESMVEPDSETIPGGGGKKMSMTDSETGDKMEFKSKRGNGGGNKK